MCIRRQAKSFRACKRFQICLLGLEHDHAVSRNASQLTMEGFTALLAKAKAMVGELRCYILLFVMAVWQCAMEGV
ncbi:hypothetical protein BCR44DRAFT_286769 [Catenaria anguillulae PL171]|uniref:Uncharacterized protein n=1 Tax=Catenaria anguillulae PL171 TaxID=765915 RepID=A0A1Y2HVZ5_9FUNG|nr:hypothetical protein BCR44DRAFT_286769 [Catenaria anguillulae PL171]